MNPSKTIYPDQWTSQQYNQPNHYSSTYAGQQYPSYDGGATGNVTYSGQPYVQTSQSSTANHRSHYTPSNQSMGMMQSRQTHQNYQPQSYSQPSTHNHSQSYSQSQHSNPSYDQSYGLSQPQQYSHSRPRSHSQAMSSYAPPQSIVIPHSNQYPGQVPLSPDASQQYHYPASPNRPYACELCSLSFNRQHDLKRHRETHTGEKPYNCNGGCGKTFTRKDALKRHQIVKGCGRVEDSWP